MLLLFSLLLSVNSLAASLATHTADNDKRTLRKNYLAEHLMEYPKKGPDPLAGPDMTVKLAYIYGADNDNMLIRFKQDSNGISYCHIGIITDKNLDDLGDMNETEVRVYPLKLVGNGDVNWVLADGTYNTQLPEPQCLYDFYARATVPFEYNLLRYCAKGYFFNGKDYADQRRFVGRKDWLLYLAQGNVECSISGNLEANRGLLARGYTVELVHVADVGVDWFSSTMCDLALGASLASYKDNDKDGDFMLAAVVGAGQLDRGKNDSHFWNAVKGEKDWNDQSQIKCKKTYHHRLRSPKNGRYYLLLVVTHYCSERGMRTMLVFDVSIGPKNVLSGIYEDTGIQIELNTGQMVRSTGQMLCDCEEIGPNPNGKEESECRGCLNNVTLRASHWITGHFYKPNKIFG